MTRTRSNESPFPRGATHLATALALLAVAVHPALAQGGVDGKRVSEVLELPTYRSPRELKAAFEPLAESVRESLAIVESEGRPRAMGAIVAADGLVLTKASEVGPSPRVILEDGRTLDAAVLASDRAYDLALLTIEAQDLKPVQWAEDEPPLGSWVVTPLLEDRPLGVRVAAEVGVLSTESAQIAVQPGLIGIEMDLGREFPVVDRVTGSCAESMKLTSKDVITHVNRKAVATRQDLISMVMSQPAGSRIQLTYKRGESSHDAEGILGHRVPQYEADAYTGSLSGLRSGFPRAFRHDTKLMPRECGGPILDSAGRVVGLNVARASRTASHAIPARTVKGIVERLSRVDGVY